MSGDALFERIEAFNRARGGGVVVRKAERGYTLVSERTGAPVARLRPTGDTDKVQFFDAEGGAALHAHGAGSGNGNGSSPGAVPAS